MKAVRRRRLALVVPNLAGGGGVQAVGRFLKNVAVRSGDFDLRLVSLSESSRDPTSLCLTSPGSWWKGPGVMRGEWEGLPYAHVGAVAGELEFQRYRTRRALTVLLADCDVIQMVCGFPAWANAVLGLGKPVAMHVATRARQERRLRDSQLRTPSDFWRKAMTTVTNRMDDSALLGVDAIQVMNPWMFEYAKVLNAGRNVDVQYLPPGIDAEAFRPAARGSSIPAATVLCVGRFSDPRKNIGLLLEAFAKLPDRVRGQARLVLAGSVPPEAFGIRAAILGLRDRIDFVEQPDPPTLLRLYQRASVFALPSDEEGFGMVLLEAMACGVPVVSTRSGGPEGIITDGLDGYLVPRNDASALSARLAQLLGDVTRATAMGATARRTVEQRYDERVLGQSFVDLWHRLGNG
ncbi:MAG: glycosyltransferase family 4 protein [Vicinamibacterales bacterium]